jgi:uncharacterized membrane protein/mono/diheme cytochrome c family protein
MLEFFGRFHPVFVHLPIGILLLACTFILMSLKNQFVGLKSSIPFILLFGAISAVFSCVTGYLLANNGDYDGELVSNHQWMGISVAIIAILFWLVYKKITSNFILGFISVTLIVLISITGHLGGSLTHGANYLTESLQKEGSKGKAAIPPIANVQEAFVYKDAIQPLLQSRCYSCHGAEKQKGKLRLDAEEYILKGGKTGVAIVPDKVEEGELIKRILLPLSDEDHMAPKEKPQLTVNEITLLKWWIANGADFKKKFKELPQSDQIKPVLKALQVGDSGVKLAESDVPSNEIGAADQKAVAILANAGVTIVPVAQNSNYLSANFMNVKLLSDSVISSIKKIKSQLVWLKLENRAINDQILAAFKDCENLTRLSLNNSSITDQGLGHLSELTELQSLSLVGTKVTVKGLTKLSKLKKLKYIYLYQTGVKRADWAMLKNLFPTATLDSGNYNVPTLTQDTAVVK